MKKLITALLFLISSVVFANENTLQIFNNTKEKIYFGSPQYPLRPTELGGLDFMHLYSLCGYRVGNCQILINTDHTAIGVIDIVLGESGQSVRGSYWYNVHPMRYYMRSADPLTFTINEIY